MSGTFRRYAVYFTPPDGELAELGAAWLGWDPARGRPFVAPVDADLPRPRAQLVATAARYGFHATLKPPFVLASGTTRTDLEAALTALATQLAPVTLTGLRLDRLGDFLALVAEGMPAQTAALRALAAQVVTRLDWLRAPPTGTELARRRAGGLSQRQEALLQSWGYPFVLDQFRFHMTLSDAVRDPDERAALRATLAPLLTPVLPRPFILDALSLMGEETGPARRFHLLGRYPLSG